MKNDSLANKAFLEIRQKILSNQFQPNTRLKEDEWAKQIGVSRMAVREALTRLLGEDLLILGEKGGYYTKGLLPGEFLQIRELREILEIGAIRLAIKKLGKKQIAALEKLCDDFSAMVKSGYLNGALEADIRFHETLIDYAENEKLKRIYMNSHIPLFHQKLFRKYISADDYNQTDSEHRQIVKALKAKKLNLAEELLRKHIERGASIVLGK